MSAVFDVDGPALRRDRIDQRAGASRISAGVVKRCKLARVVATNAEKSARREVGGAGDLFGVKGGAGGVFLCHVVALAECALNVEPLK